MLLSPCTGELNLGGFGRTLQLGSELAMVTATPGPPSLVGELEKRMSGSSKQLPGVPCQQ